MALSILALVALEQPASAQGAAGGAATGTGTGTCSSATSCSASGTTNAGSPFTASLDPATRTGSVTVDSQPSQALSITQTGTSTFVVASSTTTLDCTFTNSGMTAFSCVQVAVGSSSSSSSQQQAAFSGSSHAVARSETETSVGLQSSRIRSASGDMAHASAGGQQSELQHDYYRGLSAGSSDLKWGFWVDSSGSYVSDNSAVAEFEGFGVTELVGVDYNLDNKWLFGFSAGYVHSDVSVKAIAGHKLDNGAQFGPYISYIINSHFTVDGLFNYTRLSNTATGVVGFDSDRYTGAFDVNCFYDIGGFSLTGYAGYTYALENPTTAAAPGAIGGVPTTIHYGAFKIGGEAAYPMGNFEPYVPLTVEYETTNPKDGTGRGVVIVGAGGRYSFTDSIKGGFVVTTDELRSHSTNVVGAANLRISF